MCPVTARVTPGWRRSISGPSARTRASVSRVSCASGAVVGTAMTTPVSAPRLGVATLIEAIPGVVATSCLTSATTPSGSVVVTMSRVMTSGALAPGPKAFAMVSKACRWVVCGPDVPLLGNARARSRAGTAIVARPAMTRTAVSQGRRVTNRTQVAAKLVCRLAWCASAVCFGVSRVPANPRMAGSRVRATRTATATATAAATPMTDRKGTSATPSAARAMATVAPAKTTADPAVPVAWAAASSWVWPSAMRSRWRDRTKRA